MSLHGDNLDWVYEQIYRNYTPNFSGCTDILKAVFYKMKTSNLWTENVILFHNRFIIF